MQAPPKAPKHEHFIELHGQRWEDPYFWLRDREKPDVMEYLKAENAYTESFFSDSKADLEALFKEMRGRIKEKDASVPTPDGPYRYFTRYEQGGQYPILCRYPRDKEEEEILLDLNKLAQGKAYLELGGFSYSPDHRWLAYSIDDTGDEKYTLYVKDLSSGEVATKTKDSVYTDIVWANDNETFFYTVLDTQLRPLQVYRHKNSHADFEQDVLVYEEKDPRFFVSLGKMFSEKYVVVHLEGSHVSEEHVLDADNPDGEFRCLQPRQDNVEYSSVHHGQWFYFLTNAKGAKDFKVVRASVDQPQSQYWEDVIAHEPGRLLKSIEAFANYFVIESSENALPKISVAPIDDLANARTVPFEEAVYEAATGGYREFDTEEIRFSYESPTTPSTLYRFNLRTFEKEVLKVHPVLGGFDATQYLCKREYALAKDGTKVPISIVYRKDTPLDGSAPLYLSGYGSYGLSASARFSSTRVSLLDRGFVHATAHIRGGMDLGWDWYQNGKLLKKKNTFGDFIACGEFLAQKKYTRQGEIVAVGGSAGGMLMGVIANERPELFKAIVAHVPFVDVLNTMLDETLTLTPIEFKEWGNPKEKEYFEYIRSYSPYDNVKAQDYPHLFVLGGLNDPRVTYWEPAKWTAKLRELKTDNNTLLLKTNMGAGHGGASGRFDFLKEVAEEYAFILKVFGKL